MPAVERARAQCEIARAREAPERAELDERPERRRHEQPLALAGGLGVGAQVRRRRRRREQARGGRGDRHLDRAVIARPGERELLGALLERPLEGLAQAGRVARRRGRAAGGGDGRGEAHSPAAASASANAVRASSPRTAKTTRSSPVSAGQVARDLLGLDPRRLGDREAADAGPEGHERERAGAERVGARERARRRGPDHLGRRRAAELHRRGVDDPAGRHVARGGLDGVPEPDRRPLAGLPLDGRAARARDRRGDAAAVLELACWRRWRSRRPRGP